MELSWKKLPVTDSKVVEYLDNQLAEQSIHRRFGRVMMKDKLKHKNNFRKLYKDKTGYYVGQKDYLGTAHVTIIDGRWSIVQFTLKCMDEFKANEERKFLASIGL